MKITNFILVISITALFILIFAPFISAISCMSDVQCPGQGQNICQNKQLLYYHCIDNSCQKNSEIGSVECCSSSDCASDQTCDTQSYKCVGGLNVAHVENQICVPNSLICKDAKTLRTCSSDGTSFTDATCKQECKTDVNGVSQCLGGENSSVNGDNTLVYVMIIAGAIVLGFIILAIILSKKKKK